MIHSCKGYKNKRKEAVYASLLDEEFIVSRIVFVAFWRGHLQSQQRAALNL